MIKITHEVHFSETLDGFHTSRGALKQLLENEGHVIHDLKNDLLLSGHQRLKHFPSYVLSLSHTRGAGAAILSTTALVRSLGIDIEWRDRMMKKEAQKFFRHIEDSFIEDDLLLWTMKEAAFKALSPLGHPSSVLVLSKIIIRDGIFYSAEDHSIKGLVETSTMNSHGRELIVARASVLP